MRRHASWDTDAYSHTHNIHTHAGASTHRSFLHVCATAAGAIFKQRRFHTDSSITPSTSPHVWNPSMTRCHWVSLFLLFRERIWWISNPARRMTFCKCIHPSLLPHYRCCAFGGQEEGGRRKMLIYAEYSAQQSALVFCLTDWLILHEGWRSRGGGEGGREEEEKECEGGWGRVRQVGMQRGRWLSVTRQFGAMFDSWPWCDVGLGVAGAAGRFGLKHAEVRAHVAEG